MKKIAFIPLLLCLLTLSSFGQSRISPNQLPGMGVVTDSVTASSYTVACGNNTANSDDTHFKLFSNATSTAVTLFEAGACPWSPSFTINLGAATGAGAVTVTPTTSTIGTVGGTQGASLTINAGQAYFIYTDVSTSSCSTNGCYDALLLNSTGGTGTPVDAGSCAMSSSTTCTLTLAASVTSPICTATENVSSSPITAGCTVSGTTVTVGAASSNSGTWFVAVYPAAGFSSSVVVTKLCSGSSDSCNPGTAVSVGQGVAVFSLLESPVSITYSDSGSNTYGSSVQTSSSTYGQGIDTNVTVATTGLTTSNSITASAGALAAVSFTPTISSPSDVNGVTAASGGAGNVTLTTSSNTTTTDICLASVVTTTSTSNPFSIDSGSTGWTIVVPNYTNTDNRWGMVAWKVYNSGVSPSITFDTSGAGGSGVIRCYKE